MAQGPKGEFPVAKVVEEDSGMVAELTLTARDILTKKQQAS
jgi:hypothetical protein